MKKLNSLRDRMGDWVLPLCILIGLLMTGFAVYAASVTLAWDPSPDATVTGYRLYMGPNSGGYTNSYTVGNVTMATLTGLPNDSQLYFAATAYDASGVESEFSNEVGYHTPGGPGGTNTFKAKQVANVRRVLP